MRVSTEATQTQTVPVVHYDRSRDSWRDCCIQQCTRGMEDKCSRTEKNRRPAGTCLRYTAERERTPSGVDDERPHSVPRRPVGKSALQAAVGRSVTRAQRSIDRKTHPIVGQRPGTDDIVRRHEER